MVSTALGAFIGEKMNPKRRRTISSPFPVSRKIWQRGVSPVSELTRLSGHDGTEEGISWCVKKNKMINPLKSSSEQCTQYSMFKQPSFMMNRLLLTFNHTIEHCMNSTLPPGPVLI